MNKSAEINRDAQTMSSLVLHEWGLNRTNDNNFQLNSTLISLVFKYNQLVFLYVILKRFNCFEKQIILIRKYMTLLKWY